MPLLPVGLYTVAKAFGEAVSPRGMPMGGGALHHRCRAILFAHPAVHCPRGCHRPVHQITRPPSLAPYQACQSYAAQHDLETVALRIGNFRFASGDGSGIAALLHDVLCAALRSCYHEPAPVSCTSGLSRMIFRWPSRCRPADLPCSPRTGQSGTSSCTLTSLGRR